MSDGAADDFHHERIAGAGCCQVPGLPRRHPGCPRLLAQHIGRMVWREAVEMELRMLSRLSCAAERAW